MTKKELNIQKRRVQRLADKWIQPLGLGWWRIDLLYSTEVDRSGMTTYQPADIGGTYETVFAVGTDHNYMIARITAILPVIAQIEDERLEEYFVHELMHIFLRPMRTKQCAGEEEQVATRLARAFLWIKNSV